MSDRPDIPTDQDEVNALPRQPQGATRDALIAAGLLLFGRQGYDATSTRDLARAARTNVASIAYHFGSKEGLRLACAQSVVSRMRAVAGNAILAFDAAAGPAPSRVFLETIIDAMVDFLVLRPESADISAFILREVAVRGEGFDLIYRDLVEPVHRALCRVTGTLSGLDPESDTVRLAVFAMIGQVIYFRIGQPLVARRLGWTSVGAREGAAIKQTLKRNVNAQLDALIAAGKAGHP